MDREIEAVLTRHATEIEYLKEQIRQLAPTRAEQDPHYLRSVLDSMLIRISSIEGYIAALPGAADVDTETLKSSLRDKITEPLENVRVVTRHHWSDLQVDRINALANGKPAPEEVLQAWASDQGQNTSKQGG